MKFGRTMNFVKMKFGRVVTSFYFNAGDWKLVSGPFMILLKQQFNEI